MFASRLEESPVTVAGPVPKTRVMAPAIVFDNVSLAFDEQVVLRGISFTVPQGGMKILLGASGAGKSVGTQTCPRAAPP